jgi:uncharacterized membrane-anchored protein YitT (DUF2179 family)
MKATLLQIIGFSIFSLGLGLIYMPLGIISAGVGIVLFGLAWERVENAQSSGE